MPKKIIYNAETGEDIVTEMTADEITQLDVASTHIWHLSEKPIQVIITDRQNTLLMDSIYGLSLLGVFKTVMPPTFIEQDANYLYFDRLLPEHEVILRLFEIEINIR